MPEMMSTDESGEDDEGKAVVLVKHLQWRSEKVNRFFSRLDAFIDQGKSEQAHRQTKPRKLVKNKSSPLPPTSLSDIPPWALSVAKNGYVKLN